MKPSGSKIVDCLISTSVEGAVVNSVLPNGLNFEVSAPRPTMFTIRSRDPVGNPSGKRMLECLVSSPYEVDSETYDFVECLNRGIFKRYDGMKLSIPFLRSGRVVIDAENRLVAGESLRVDEYPSKVQELYELATKELNVFAERFITLLRWRQGADSAHRSSALGSLCWKTEGETFRYAGHRTQSVTIGMMRGITWGDPERTDLAAVWSDTTSAEPIGHELIREAFEVAGRAPRSALLIATSALEAAVDMFVRKLKRKGLKRISKRPEDTPKVIHILQTGIADMLGRQPLPEWAKIQPEIDLLKESVRHRNDLAHEGIFEINSEKITAYLKLVRDFIYIIDFLDGRAWAKNHVSSKTARKLGWPSQRELVTKITMA